MLWAHSLLEELDVRGQTRPLMSRGKLLEWKVLEGLTLSVAYPMVFPILILLVEVHYDHYHAWGRWAQTMGMNRVTDWLRGGHVT